MNTGEIVYKKGDRRYLLTKNGNDYHFKKLIKKRLKNAETKTTKVIVSDFHFSGLSELTDDFLIKNGMRENDNGIIQEMIKQMKEKQSD